MAEPPNEAKIGAKFILPLVAATAGITVLSVGMLWLIPGPERATSNGGVPAAGRGPKRARPTAGLFKELCSLCHGAGGAGDGPTELERPARSFLAGGYGYGNTLATVMRTLEFGIPGTAMPAFAETLSLQERTALAGFVLGLGPQPRTVAVGAGQVNAGTRPVVVQGAMRDPSTGALEPRSLLVGFPDGTCVQYRTQDLAVVAIYSGDRNAAFVTRTDWRGQGGTPLRPLSERVWSLTGEPKGAAFITHGTSTGRPLMRRLRSTRIRAADVVLHFDLLDSSGTLVGSGTETVRILGEGEGPLARSLDLDPGSRHLRPLEPKGERVPAGSNAGAHRVAPGLFLVDPKESTTRHLIYADTWTASMGAVL